MTALHDIEIDNFYIGQINNLIASGRDDLVPGMAADFTRAKAQQRRAKRCKASGRRDRG